MTIPIRKGAQRDGRCRNGQKGTDGRKEGGSAVPISGKGVPLFGQMTPLPSFLPSSLPTDRLTYTAPTTGRHHAFEKIRLVELKKQKKVQQPLMGT